MNGKNFTVRNGFLCNPDGSQATVKGQPIPVSSNHNLPYGVLPTETAGGKKTTSRLERPEGAPGRKIFSLELLNTDAANAYEGVIFDGNGFIADDLGISALNGVVTVDGSAGASSLAALKTVAITGAVDIHAMHLRGYDLAVSGTAANPGTNTPATGVTKTPSETILLGDNFKWAEKPDLNTNATTNTFGLSIDTDGSTFDATVRRFECRFQGQAWTGIYFNLPALTGFAMNFEYSALAIARNMNLV